MIDIVVVSHACFTAINRKIYGRFKQHGWSIELVVPQTLQFPSVTKQAEPEQPGDPKVHFLALEGTNPRTYHFVGLFPLLEQLKPRIILLDNDPVSELAVHLGKWAATHSAALFCISCENLPLGIFATAKRRGLKSIPASVYKRILLARSRRRMKGVFTINKEGATIFQEEGFSQVVQIPLGFDRQYFFPDETARRSIREAIGLRQLTFAYFGRLTREKGLHIFIAALEQLKQYPWQLVMDHFDASATEYTQEVSRLLEAAGLLDRVVFVSPSHTEIAAYMNAVDIIVVPSVSTAQWKEQYGRVAAEALACGKKVVASDSGALPDLTGGRADLFEEGNVAALRTLLEKYLKGDNTIAPFYQDVADYAHESLSLDRQLAIMEAIFTREKNRS